MASTAIRPPNGPVKPLALPSAIPIGLLEQCGGYREAFDMDSEEGRNLGALR